MFVSDRHGQRGQTIPFWVFSIILSLTLSLFVMNYTNTVRWHVRAQNAADAAALAAMSGEAAMYNQRMLAQYAAAYDEYRLQSILLSLANAANSVGADSQQSSSGNQTRTCDPNSSDVGQDCNSAYADQVAYYDYALAQYEQAVIYLESLGTPTTATVSHAPVVGTQGSYAALPSAPSGSMAAAAFSIPQSDSYCWDRTTTNSPGVFDCSFYYNADLSKTGPNSQEIADVVACHSVKTQSSGLFSGLQPRFNAVGRSFATLMPVTIDSFDAGGKPNVLAGAGAGGATTPPYAEREECPTADGTPCTGGLSWIQYPGFSPVDWSTFPSYVTDFMGLCVNVTFYVPVLTQPTGSTPSWTLSCQQG